MDVERARVLAVIISIREAIAADRAGGVVHETEAWAFALVQRACAEHGLSVEAWHDALQADAETLRLFEQALMETVVELPDPGPYDAISRESSRGAPETGPEGFARDARLLGRAPR